MTDHVITEMDEHFYREERVLARLRRRAEDYARKPPETQPAMWSVIVIGLSAGAAMLAAGSVFAAFFL
jgi:anti-sigma factor RsiW